MFQVNLSGKNAWVTGASRGIGKATAKALAKAGCNVAIGYHKGESEAANLATELTQEFGIKAVISQMEVKDKASCEQAYEGIKAALGPVDILVNNAGVIADNLFMMIEEDEWQSVLNTNIMGVVHTTKAVVRDMMMKRKGRIINISSVAATKGGRGQSNYAASKGAIEAMTRSLAVELASRNITVNCIAPGVVDTDMSKEIVKLAHDEIMNRQLIKRLGKPEEIAAFVVFVASEYADFMTGQTILVDGGLKMP